MFMEKEILKCKGCHHIYFKGEACWCVKSYFVEPPKKPHYVKGDPADGYWEEYRPSWEYTKEYRSAVRLRKNLERGVL